MNFMPRISIKLSGYNSITYFDENYSPPLLNGGGRCDVLDTNEYSFLEVC